MLHALDQIKPNQVKHVETNSNQVMPVNQMKSILGDTHVAPRAAGAEPIYGWRLSHGCCSNSRAVGGILPCNRDTVRHTTLSLTIRSNQEYFPADAGARTANTRPPRTTRRRCRFFALGDAPAS